MNATHQWRGLLVLFLAGCGLFIDARGVTRNDDGEFEPIAGMAVTPEEALVRAEPYLDLTFQLRRRDRGEDEMSDRPATDHIAVKDDWYYIARDNYPSHSPGFYLPHAVRVHGQTGQLLPPE
jgi:hypothetical protein